MRLAKSGKERWVVRLMKKGDRSGAVAYMKAHGLIEAFAGAPEWKAVSSPEPGPRPIVSSPEEAYPIFQPLREPVPEGVVYGRIKRELGHELQKVVVFEEQDDLPEHKRREALLWMSLREQKDQMSRKGRIIGAVFPIEKNPDDRQGGYRIWHP